LRGGNLGKGETFGFHEEERGELRLDRGGEAQKKNLNSLLTPRVRRMTSLELGGIEKKVLINVFAKKKKMKRREEHHSNQEEETELSFFPMHRQRRGGKKGKASPKKRGKRGNKAYQVSQSGKKEALSQKRGKGGIFLVFIFRYLFGGEEVGEGGRLSWFKGEEICV